MHDMLMTSLGFEMSLLMLTTDFIAVSSCLDVMIRCYDNDTTIDLIGRYYSAFNESTCQSASQWKIFMDTTLLLMGFPETLRKSMIQVIFFLNVLMFMDSIINLSTMHSFFHSFVLIFFDMITFL